MMETDNKINNNYRALREKNNAMRDEALREAVSFDDTQPGGALWLGAHLAKKLADKAVSSKDLRHMEQYEVIDPRGIYKVNNESYELVNTFSATPEIDNAVENGKFKQEYLTDGWRDPLLRPFAGTHDDGLWLGLHLREYMRIHGEKEFGNLLLRDIKTEDVYHIEKKDANTFAASGKPLSEDTLREIKYLQEDRDYEPDVTRLDYSLLMDNIYGDHVKIIVEAVQCGALDYRDLERAIANNFKIRPLACIKYEKSDDKHLEDIIDSVMVLEEFEVMGANKRDRVPARKLAFLDEEGKHIYVLERERPKANGFYTDHWYFAYSFIQESAKEFVKQWDAQAVPRGKN